LPDDGRDRTVSIVSKREDGPSALTSADPIRNFTLTTEERIRALTIGPPAWAVRKRKMEDDATRMAHELVELHDALAARGKERGEIDLAVTSAATALDLTKLNALVQAHNRYYPIEANLPMDRHTGGYLVYGQLWQPEEPFTPTRILAMARDVLTRRTE